MEHLEKAAKEHSLLRLAEEHEKETIRRLGKEFIERREVYQESSNVKEGTRKEREQNGKEKSRMDTCKRPCQRMSPLT